jgi:hypothetical protein
MRVLALCHGLWYGGAQVSTVEFLRLIKDNLSVHVVVCNGANPDFVRDIEGFGLRQCLQEFPIEWLKIIQSWMLRLLPVL